MNLRIKRLESDMMREVSMLLQTEVKNPILKSVVVTGCHITNDLSFAKIYYTILGDETEEERTEMKKELKHAGSYFRRLLSDKLDMRHTPEVQFVYDASIEYGKKIEEKLEDIHKKEQNEMSE